MDQPSLDLLLRLAGEVLRRPVGPEDNFFALSADSLAAVEYSLRVEEALGREVDIALLYEAATFADYARLVG
ncbi:acyl carrier protein [Streptomyces litchfieldiae]|uniref:Acyl carrier protein n=1 Tax=Streptomyces litchfieldiae TaxID=3075543 RepID=A0ABU2MQT9_9ACTN|nr:acyl carrier protein [Streptomyces sp. DSM 44938]MDT0343983.1 acyl carrier protein [Streptomyces sp. DSM 44938]